jgi:hypothetical protein
VRSPQKGYRRALAISRNPPMKCGLARSRNSAVSAVLRLAGVGTVPLDEAQRQQRVEEIGIGARVKP